MLSEWRPSQSPPPHQAPWLDAKRTSLLRNRKYTKSSLPPIIPDNQVLLAIDLIFKKSTSVIVGAWKEWGLKSLRWNGVGKVVEILWSRLLSVQLPLFYGTSMNAAEAKHSLSLSLSLFLSNRKSRSVGGDEVYSVKTRELSREGQLKFISSLEQPWYLLLELQTIYTWG